MLALGIAVVLAGIALVWNWPRLGWVLLGVAVLMDTTDPSPLLSTGGISVYPLDVLAVLLMAAGLLNARRIGNNMAGRSVAVWGIVVLLLFSLTRGLLTYGQASLNEFRSFAYVATTLVWALGLDWRSDAGRSTPRRDFQLWLTLTATALTIMTAYNLTKTGFVSADAYYVDPHGDFISLRPVTAGQAMFIALAALWALGRFMQDRRARWLALASAFLAAILVAQHRSVWVALLAGLLLTILFAYPKARRLGISLLALLAAAGVFGIVYAWGTSLVASIWASVQSAVAPESTYTDRTSTWATLVHQNLDAGLTTALFGKPFGAGFLRQGPNFTIETFMPHNWYVSIFLRTGVLGLAMLVAILVRLARKQFTAPRDSIGLGLLAAIVVYIYVYSLPWYIAPVVAVLWLRPFAPAVSAAEHPAEAVPARS